MRLTYFLVFLGGCTCSGPPRTELPTYHAHRAGPITVDGHLDDWSGVPETELFVNTMDGSGGSPEVRARMAWDESGLYVAASIPDTYLVATNEDRDDHLWEEDCLELMIDRDAAEGEGLGEGYVELQISPRNQIFDTWFDTYRAPPPFGHVSWDSGIETAVVTHGSYGDEASDEGYDVEARIPWTALATRPNPTAPPSAGETIRVALYVLDAQPGGQGAVAWSPPLVGDFHVPARMGRVVLDP